MNKNIFNKMRRQMEPGEKTVSDLYKKIKEQKDVVREKRTRNKYVAVAVSVSAVVLLFAGISTSMKLADNKRNANPYEAVYKSFQEIQREQERYRVSDDVLDEKVIMRGDAGIAEDGASAENAVPKAALPEENAAPELRQQESAENINAEEGDFSKTNEQVEGVHESDIVKTDGEYIYRLSKEKQAVYIIKAEGGTCTQVHKLSVKEEVIEMYLENDRLVLLSQKKNHTAPVPEDSLRSYSPENPMQEESVIIDIYDVSEPETTELFSEYTQDGSYRTSRMIGEHLYLVSEKGILALPKNPKEYEKYIPYYIQNNREKVLIDAGQIHVNRSQTSMNYLLISGHDIHERESMKSIQSYTGFSDKYYVSMKNFYITFAKPKKTRIVSLSLHDGMIREKAKGSVKGMIRDQFSMDEYRDYFRVVTTSFTARLRNNLYILDEHLKQVGSIENIAKNEEVKSVRYDKERAYLVTFKLTDPLFTIDCSNPLKPRLLGKLKIPGYSTYMHNVDESTVLGFGNEADEDTGIPTGLKLSLFDVSNRAHPKELAKFILKRRRNILFAESYSHKDLFIDTERKLIGFPVMEDYDKKGYTLFSFKNNKFVQLFNIRFSKNGENGGSTYPDIFRFGFDESIFKSQFVRGILIDEYLYLLDSKKIMVLDKNYKKTEELKFK